MERIRAVFSRNPSIPERLQQVLARYPDPDLIDLFSDVVEYVADSNSNSNSLPQLQGQTQQNGKKRKLDANDSPAVDTSDLTPSFQCRDVSFAIPARKKLKLELLRSTTGSAGQIRLVDPKTDSVEYTLRRDDISHVFCLPVPEKAQRQQNYVVLPKQQDVEQIVFTINEAPDKQNTVVMRSGNASDGETLVNITTEELKTFGLQVERPNADEFACSISEPHRKGEKAYHVKAFRGNKEGYLYFLSSGILFGFKKPLTFFAFADIESISYTSVLQRTFNLVVTQISADGTSQDIEFSMLDQADFAGIDAYIKAHGLNDASMAAERRAKMYNVNKPKGEAANGEVNGDGAPAEAELEDGQTELQRAEQQLQDEEDELEEDYDPSGGESDGEGEDSEEEAYDAGGDNEQADQEVEDEADEE